MTDLCIGFVPCAALAPWGAQTLPPLKFLLLEVSRADVAGPWALFRHTTAVRQQTTVECLSYGFLRPKASTSLAANLITANKYNPARYQQLPLPPEQQNRPYRPRFVFTGYITCAANL